MPADAPALDVHQLATAIAPLVADRLAPLLRPEDRLLDREELAERLGVCPRSVGTMAARGDLPPGVLLGGVRRWSWQSVAKHLEALQGRPRPRRGRGIRRKRAEEAAESAAD